MKNPINTSPCQRLDGRLKSPSIMTVQQKGGRISQGDPSRVDVQTTLSQTSRCMPLHKVPQEKPH